MLKHKKSLKKNFIVTEAMILVPSFAIDNCYMAESRKKYGKQQQFQSELL
jgi:hypothetical protein